jgi:hypothetical protein
MRGVQAEKCGKLVWARDRGGDDSSRAGQKRHVLVRSRCGSGQPDSTQVT